MSTARFRLSVRAVHDATRTRDGRKVSISTIHRLTDAGLIPHVRDSAGRRLYDENAAVLASLLFDERRSRRA